ncbi:unnamed protein product [Moneuplotes crassus]|uniref:Metaxin glutathione S-transferase domain-containing protein n=1 Tax=Euplotes crassus TaxID=5936 RepID=A0AAD1XHS6_EUPCR|nr:unnamed protein product [Moneuplotes crassus]
MEKAKVQLFTRKELVQKPGLIRKLLNWVSSNDKADEKQMVFAEELFVDSIGKFLNLDIHKKYDTEAYTVEDPFGTYPCMTIHNSFIAREYIIQYFKQVTNINDWLSVPQLRTCEWYEQIVMTKLNLVTRTLMFNQHEKFAFSLMKYIYSPIRSYMKYSQLKRFMNCCSTTIGCSATMSDKNNMQCYDIARDIYEKLNTKLENNDYFFQKDDELTKQVSSLDLVVYCYLKEQLVNIPKSEIVGMLKNKFPNLVKFVKRMEKGLKTPEKASHLRTQGLGYKKNFKECQATVKDFFQPSEYTSKDSQLTMFEDKSQASKVNTRKLCVLFMSCAFMLHLRFGRTEMNPQ